MAHLKDWMSLSTPDPEWDSVVNTVFNGNAPDIGVFPDIPSLRAWFTESRQAAVTDNSVPKGVVEKDHQVEMRDGHKISVRVHAPQEAPREGSPLVVVYHGGGFCIGDLMSEEAYARGLVIEFGAVVANVDYRLAPEWKFPTAPNDCIDATIWVTKNLALLGARPECGFVLAGTSAGGCLTSVVEHVWRERQLMPPVTGCHYMIPVLVHSDHVPSEHKSGYLSWEQNKDAAVLSRRACHLFFDNYLQQGYNDPKGADPFFSPLRFASGYGGHPSSYFQVCGSDPLRDDALIFEKILREEENVSTRVDVYPGQPHAFWTIVPTMQASAKFVEDSMKGVGWLLKKSDHASFEQGDSK